MSDNYDAVYNAVRSKLTDCDMGSVIEQAISNMNLSHYVMMAMETIKVSAAEYERPSITMRPKVYPDGNEWCALYGDDLQSGVAGFGKSPSLAMYDFDKNWFQAIKEIEQEETQK